MMKFLSSKTKKLSETINKLSEENENLRKENKRLEMDLEFEKKLYKAAMQHIFNQENKDS